MFKKLTDDARLPERATKFSAGFDVFANEDVVIGAGDTKLIGLGIALDESWISNMSEHGKDEFMKVIYLMLCLRSSLGAKGLILPNGHGVIDIDYKDEIKMVVHNPITKIEDFQGGVTLATCWNGHHEMIIKKGDKIGQLILCRHEGWLLPSKYTKDKERVGGFGSTGEQ